MRRVAAVVAGLLAVAVAAPALAAGPRSYAPPFQPGPQGGDQYNVVNEDANGGRVSVLRAYPMPGSFNCAGNAGFANLQVTHLVGPEGIGRVEVDFADSVWDGYTFVSVHVRTVKGKWLGYGALRGPVFAAGTISVRVSARVKRGTPVRITFGIATSSACPSVGGGTVHFTSVRVQPRGASPRP